MDWENEMKSIIKVCLTIIISLCYCYFIASKIQKGKPRLLSLLPIFIIFTILPLSLSSVLPIGITSLFITWLANFKLLLFSFDLGPLSSPKPKSLLLFTSVASLPIKIIQNQHRPDNSPLKLIPKVLIFSILVPCGYNYKDHLHPKGIMVIYCFSLFLFVELFFGLCNYLVRITIGIELEPPSDEPYLTTSLGDFWGKRWNLMVTNVLRHTVYKPVRSVLGPLPAVILTFIVSGLMHELMFFHVTRVSPTWEVTCFFVIHGVAVVVEFWVKRALTNRWHVALSGSLTLAFVVVSSVCLFFPPLVRNGADVRAIIECIDLMNFVEQKFKINDSTC